MLPTFVIIFQSDYCYSFFLTLKIIFFSFFLALDICGGNEALENLLKISKRATKTLRKGHREEVTGRDLFWFPKYFIIIGHQNLKRATKTLRKGHQGEVTGQISQILY